MKKPKWMRVVYEDGELWIDGIHMRSKVGVQKFFAEPFNWVGDVKGFIRKENNTYKFYTDEQMKEIEK